MEKDYKILVVDDSISSLKLISEILLFNSYNILKTTSGKNAITLAVEYEPDLIILDIMMPNVDGHVVLKYIKSFDFLKDKYIIMLTASSNIADVQKSKQAGITDYILKPISINNFVDKIKKLLPKSNYDEIGSYLNGDNYIEEHDEDADMTEVDETIKKLLQKKKSRERLGDVMKKGIKQSTKIQVIDGYPVKLVEKHNLKPGMVPAVDIKTKSGMIVHPSGLELNDKIISKLIEIDIEEKDLYIRG